MVQDDRRPAVPQAGDTKIKAAYVDAPSYRFGAVRGRFRGCVKQSDRQDEK